MNQDPQQPYVAPQYNPPVPTSQWGSSSLGMEAHILAGLTWLSMILLGPIIPIVIFFVEKTNRFVKFHAAQAILLSAAGVIFWVVVSIINVIVFSAATAASTVNSAAAAGGATAGLGALGLLSCLYFIVGLAFLGIWIWGIIAAFTGKATKLPIIGGFAERMAGGAPGAM